MRSPARKRGGIAYKFSEPRSGDINLRANSVSPLRGYASRYNVAAKTSRSFANARSASGSS